MAEAAIVAALTILGKPLASELVKRTLSQSSTVCFSNLEATMNNINRELRLLQEFIGCTNIHDESNMLKVIWVNDVRKLAYEIEDSVAEFVYLAGNKNFGTKISYVKWFFINPKWLNALIRVSTQLLEVERRIKDLVEGRNRWASTSNYNRIREIPNISNERSHNIVAECSYFIAEENLVGIEEHKIKLTSWLNSSDEKLSIISVWGMGGVGKTTLVANVFNKEKKLFGCNAWITISQNYTIENILQSLISEICKNGKLDPIDATKMSIRHLIEYLWHLLTNKKYLIVLDDIWNPTAFQDVRDAFIENHRGSRIMITSRILQVACLAPQSNRLKLNTLQENESWELFCRKAFVNFERNYECPSHLKKWAKEIVGKCDGLPLALVLLGRLLSLYGDEESEWKHIHDQLTWQLQNNSKMSHLINILSLSFNYLPRHLKNCFLYCGLFPEDFLIARKKLIRLWVAEGFVEQKGSSTLEDVAEGYLKELIHRSMLQVVTKNYSGRVKRCRMHDILRELALSFCRKENFGLLNEGSISKDPDSSTRRLSIIKLKEYIMHDVCLPHLRTFMSFGPDVPSSPFLSSTFDKSRYLAILDLHHLPIETIPNSIGDLFNLHYLGLRKTMVKFLPISVKKLHNLQTLDLCFSQIQKLPDGIIELKKLRHLFAEIEIDRINRSLHNYIGISLPKGVFCLKELQTIQGVESNDMVVRELGNLTQLRSFRIRNVKESHSTDLCKSLSKMRSLSYLSINACNENEILCLEGLDLPQIQKLVLRGGLRENVLQSRLFQVFGEGIQNLTLALSQLRNDPLPYLCHLRNLSLLDLSKAYEGQKLKFRARWFPKLKRLALRQMPNLVNMEMEKGTMECLEQIELWELKQLVKIPKGMHHLISLKWMFLLDMPANFGGFAKGRHKLFHFICIVR